MDPAKTEGTQPAPEGANADQGTQPAADAANAATSKFTDDDMAAARKAWEKKTARDSDKAKAAWERERLESLDAGSWEELQERLDGKKQAESELEKQLTEAKRQVREARKLAADRDELHTKLQRLQTERNQHAMRSAVYDAARKIDAHEKLVFAMLVADGRIGVDDDGAVFVRGDDGEPSGQSLEKIITQLVGENAALQRPSGAPGGGSLPQSTGARPGGSNGSPTERMKAGVADMVTQAYSQFIRR